LTGFPPILTGFHSILTNFHEILTDFRQILTDFRQILTGRSTGPASEDHPHDFSVTLGLLGKQKGGETRTLRAPHPPAPRGAITNQNPESPLS
jgi:hypothetical protein